jgi:hypothetical protein
LTPVAQQTPEQYARRVSGDGDLFVSTTGEKGGNAAVRQQEQMATARLWEAKVFWSLFPSPEL